MTSYKAVLLRHRKIENINTEIGYVLGLHMRDDIRSQLTDFAAEFMADAQVEQRLKEVFEKHIDTARVSRERQAIMNN